MLPNFVRNAKSVGWPWQGKVSFASNFSSQRHRPSETFEAVVRAWWQVMSDTKALSNHLLHKLKTSCAMHRRDEYQCSQGPIRIVPPVLAKHRPFWNTTNSHSQTSPGRVATWRDRQSRITSRYIYLRPDCDNDDDDIESSCKHWLMTVMKRVVCIDWHWSRSSVWHSWNRLISHIVFNYRRRTCLWQSLLDVIIYSCIFALCPTGQMEQDRSFLPL